MKYYYINIYEVNNLTFDNLSSKILLVSSFLGKNYLYSFYFCILIKFFKFDKKILIKKIKFD